MNRRITGLLVVIAVLAWNILSARADETNEIAPVALISRIDKLGASTVINELLAKENKAKLDRVLRGIQSGEDKWLEVHSKLRPALMASMPAMPFDNAASEALENNTKGVLRNAAIINREWAKLANTSEQEIDYPARICSVFSADWNEEMPRPELALKTIPRLKKRQKLVMDLSSPGVSDEIKNSCLKTIADSLAEWGKELKTKVK